MRQRYRDKRPVGGTEPVAARERQRGMDDAEMSKQRALGLSRGARGIEDDSGVLLRYRRGRQVGICRHQRIEAAGAGDMPVHRKHLPQAGHSRPIGQGFGQIVVDDEHARAAVGQQEFHFRPLLARPDRHRDGAEPRTGEDQSEEFPAVRQHHHHAVAGADTVRC